MGCGYLHYKRESKPLTYGVGLTILGGSLFEDL